MKKPTDDEFAKRYADLVTESLRAPYATDWDREPFMTVADMERAHIGRALFHDGIAWCIEALREIERDLQEGDGSLASSLEMADPFEAGRFADYLERLAKEGGDEGS